MIVSVSQNLQTNFSIIKYIICYLQLMWYWKVHHSSWPLWPCRYMEVIDWCTSSPSLGSWEIPLWCIHQSGTLSTKMNPKAMTLHISPSLSQDHGIIFCLFTFLRFSLFHSFITKFCIPWITYMTSCFYASVINVNSL